MDKKSFTFLITSNRKGRTHSLTLPSAWIKTAGFVACTLAIFLAATSVDYLGLLLKEGENKRLTAENAMLNKQLKMIEGKVSVLERVVERVKSFETKLKLITNVGEDPNHALQLAVGPMPKSGQAVYDYDEDGDSRGPASEFLQKDAQFLRKPPLDDIRNELSNYKHKNYASLSIRIDSAVREAQLRETSVLSLHESLGEIRSRINATPSIKPANGWYTSRFGYRIDPFTGKPIMHKGLDMAAPHGSPVRAPAAGQVSYVAYEPGYGKVVSIDHGYGVKTRFAHNSQILVELGQKVERGDIISQVGSTGRSSGAHLHYEVRIHNVPVDPINYILIE